MQTLEWDKEKFLEGEDYHFDMLLEEINVARVETSLFWINHLYEKWYCLRLTDDSARIISRNKEDCLLSAEKWDESLERIFGK
jgi:outer membrane protein assembly factor BamD (BamD/ComL family)